MGIKTVQGGKVMDIFDVILAVCETARNDAASSVILDSEYSESEYNRGLRDAYSAIYRVIEQYKRSVI